MRAPAPNEIDWLRLSPRGRAILAWIAVPIATGLDHTELTDRLNLQRPEIPDLPLPEVVNTDWIGKQLRRLRAELQGEDAGGLWE